ncbi:MAG: SIS domain-containing protein [Gammaproteobacteria bacterium]
MAKSLDLAGIEAAARETVRRWVTDPAISNRDRLVLTGSGDSLFAARATAPALKRWTGLQVQPMTAMEFARYEVALVGERDVLVALSNSGSSSRTREAVLLARAAGIPSLGITGSPDGPLARTADAVLLRSVLPLDDLPGDIGRVFLNLVEYCAALHALYAFGLEMGLANGRVDEAQRDACLLEARQAVANLGSMADAMAPDVEALVESAPDIDTLWIIGAGPNAGTADYSAAKLHEQVPINGISQDLEEWAHLQYFLTLAWKERSIAVVLAPLGNAFDRAMELVVGIRGAGGRCVLVTNTTQAVEPAECVIRVPAPADELLTPITFHLPCQLIALRLAQLRDVRPTPLRRRDDYWLIRKGAVRSDLSGLS